MIECKTKGCSNQFVQYSTLQNKCIPCSIKKGRKIEAKIERKETRAAKLAIKSKGQWAKEAQQAFNRWVRARDFHRGCVCCNNKHYQGQYHAGHYLSVGAYPELRFSLINCHKQKSSCNNYKSGNQVNYRRYLIGIIGVENVEWLESKHEPKRYTIEDYKEIKTGFNAWARELEKQNEAEYV